MAKLITYTVLSILLLACGGRDPSPDSDGGVTNEAIAQAVEDCGGFGNYASTTSARLCNGLPRNGETVSIQRNETSGASEIAFGELRLTITSVDPSCAFEATACSASLAFSGDDVGYVSFQAAGSFSAAPISLLVEGSHFVDELVASCNGEGTYELTALEPAPCDILGSYRSESDAALATGSCSTIWSAGEVTVSVDVDDSTAAETLYVVDWAGTQIDELTLNTETCELTGSRGVSTGTSFDIWNFNGRQREAVISLTRSGQMLSGTVSDETDDGAYCAGGSFTLISARQTRLVGDFGAACDTLPPSICGDGVCAEGESCDACRADCGCVGSDTCTSRGDCRQPCANIDGSGCDADQNCRPLDSNAPVHPADDFYCTPAGPSSEGMACSMHEDCAAGLACHRSGYGSPGSPPTGLCVVLCDDATTQCASTSRVCDPFSQGGVMQRGAFGGCVEECAASDVGSTDVCMDEGAACSASRGAPNADPRCVVSNTTGLGMIGQPCSESVACEPGLQCLGNADDGYSCVRYCSENSDCPTDFADCVLIGQQSTGATNVCAAPSAFGDPCQGIFEACGLGFVCATVNANTTCYEECSGPGDCPSERPNCETFGFGEPGWRSRCVR